MVSRKHWIEKSWKLVWFLNEYEHQVPKTVFRDQEMPTTERYEPNETTNKEEKDMKQKEVLILFLVPS